MIHRRLTRPARLAAAGLTLALGACHVSFDVPEDPVSPVSTRSNVAVVGRAERSLTVQLVVTADGAEVAPSAVTFGALPATAVRFNGDGSATLLEAGRVSIVASAAGVTDTTVLTVAVPPTVVFDREESGVHHIYSVVLDGALLTRLTNGTTDDVHPSAGGGRVVYASLFGGQSDIKSVSLGGGTSTSLTNTSSSFEVEPSLTADGKRLAFVRYDVLTQVPKAFVAAGDGTGAVRATTSLGDASSAEGAPHWNAAGDLLTLMSTASGSAQPYVLSPGAGTVRPVGVGVGPNVDPALNAAGSYVAFGSARSNAPGLYEANANSGGAVWLVRGNIGAPAWTADGRIVYTSYDGGSSSLHWIDPADPSVVHDIPTGVGAAAHPALVP